MGKILWLASYPKSGNTWMWAFLHNLIHDKGGPFDLAQLHKSALMDAAREHYAAVTRRDHNTLSADDFVLLRPRAQAMMAASKTGTVMVKTHSALTMLSGWPSHDPDLTLGAIYIMRDPRDVAVSYADHLGISIDAVIGSMAVRYARTEATQGGVAEFIGSWSQNVAGWTAQPAESVLTVRYEDMLAKPKVTFAGVVAFLHLPHDSRTIRKVIENTSFKQLAHQEKRAVFREHSPSQKKFFHRGRVGGWRAILTPEQTDRFVGDHQEVMARFGYLDEES